MKSILDPEFHYTPSVETDLRKTFARIRREQQRQQEARALAEADARGRRCATTTSAAPTTAVPST